MRTPRGTEQAGKRLHSTPQAYAVGHRTRSVTVNAMSDPEKSDLREQAADALRKLAGISSDDDVSEAKRLVLSLRNAKHYELMGNVAEAVSRRDPKDATNRRLYAQYLIESGKVTAAIDLLRPLLRLPRQHPEYAEAAGLIGRSYKQI